MARTAHMTRWHRAQRTLCGALCLALGALPGCRSHTGPARQAAPARVSPVVRGAGSGLEVWYWVVSDERIVRRPEPELKPRPLPRPGSTPERSAAADDFTARRRDSAREKQLAPEEQGPPAPSWALGDDKRNLEEVLAPYTDRETHVADEVRQRWARSGLRIYAVPCAELERLEAELRLVGPVQRQWLGEMPAWVAIAEGPWDEAASQLQVSGDRVRFGPGRLRLLARAWTAPASGAREPTATLRVELVPQHEPLRTEQQKMLVAAGLSPGDEARGLAIERLGLGQALSGEDALVIVPVDAPIPERLGPFEDPARTLGQAMLTRPATETTARARAVIVLLPHVAGRFGLLP